MFIAEKKMLLIKFTFFLTYTGENIIKGLTIDNQRGENQCCSFPSTFTHCSSWCSVASIASSPDEGNSLWVSSEASSQQELPRTKCLFPDLTACKENNPFLYFFSSRVMGSRMPCWPMRDRRSHRAVPCAMWHCNKEQGRGHSAGLRKGWMSACCRKT